MQVRSSHCPPARPVLQGPCRRHPKGWEGVHGKQSGHLGDSEGRCQAGFSVRREGSTPFKPGPRPLSGLDLLIVPFRALSPHRLDKTPSLASSYIRHSHSRENKESTRRSATKRHRRGETANQERPHSSSGVLRHTRVQTQLQPRRCMRAHTHGAQACAHVENTHDFNMLTLTYLYGHTHAPPHMHTHACTDIPTHTCSHAHSHTSTPTSLGTTALTSSQEKHVLPGLASKGHNPSWEMTGPWGAPLPDTQLVTWLLAALGPTSPTRGPALAL